ncbi:enoyl-CoA hydratase/isomerase family protein [Comamonadaceae bacterium G21597-S1]|nr:enoyl-CoA hydratase/isomerase family protein [Comamonadaceae bacterium G21597-S1]
MSTPMTPGPTLVQVTRDDGIVHIRLNRPDKGNALSAALVADIDAAVHLARKEPTRLMVLSGEGKHFCTGFDLSSLEHETDDSLLARFTRVELMLQAIHTAPFPTLALAHGRTMGAGADIVCACSERWIVDDAQFAFPGAGFGLVLGTARLAEAVGAAVTHRWIETGETIPAEAALTHGLAQRRVARATLADDLHARCVAARRLDATTHAAIHAATENRRRPRAACGAAADLATLVASAARAGLKDRILAYTQRQLRK